MKKIHMEFDVDDINILFNTLLLRNKSVSSKQNIAVTGMLNKMWFKVADDFKKEALKNMSFRKKLDEWSVFYAPDISRLSIHIKLKK